MGTTIVTVTFILGMTLFSQFIAIFLQYKMNKDYKELGYWLVGSGIMTLAFILMPLVTVKNLKYIAMIANPLLILGHIFFYLGIKRFLNAKSNKWIQISIFFIFNLLYYYYMLIHNNLSVRTVLISGIIAIISFLIVYQLLCKKDKLLSNTTNYISLIFFVYGSTYIFRIFFIIISDPKMTYVDQGNAIVYIIVFSIIISNLWTFGLIALINQKLNKENKVKKEKLELIFNTNIDAQLITRLEDGFIINVNDEFSILSGYSKDEVIGKSIEQISFWDNYEDRNYFIKDLKDKGICKNREFVFQRKNTSKFPSIISARIIKIGSENHIISVVRDITEEKLVETKMKKLIEQLEIEKKTAQLNAITDSLTGLYNRGYFDNTLRVEFFRLMRSGGKLSLIMLDIDHFKKFNDTYGHLAGDRCIQMICSMLKNSIIKRAPDIAARYGGEEFILILPETDENGAKILGERIRKGVEDLAIPHKASETAKFVTVSVGVVTVYPSQLESPEQVIKLVDQALYSAKGGGRNRCVFESNIK